VTGVWRNYVIKSYSRRTCIKNGDVYTRHVSYYRVIKDMRLCTSLISIYERRVTSERVAYLISSWGPMPLI
jgi:hypothetical protein